MDAITAANTNFAPADNAAMAPYRRAETLHPALRNYVEAVSRILDTTPVADAPKLVEREMATLLSIRELLRADQRASDTDSYRRHLLYADPKGRFTVLALVWAPDQRTCVHGHHAWGAVGMYDGKLYSTGYRLDDAGGVAEVSDLEFGPGAACSLPPGADGIHRLHNRSYRLAVSIHTYGMDLVDEPAAINRIYAE